MRQVIAVLVLAFAAVSTAWAAAETRPQPELVAPETGSAWRETAKQRTSISIALFVVEQVATCGFLVWLVVSGKSASAAEWLESRIPVRSVRYAVFLTAFLALLHCLALPFDAIRYALGRSYDIVTQPLLSWLGDYALECAVNAPIFVGVGLGFFWLVRVRPSTWWRWVAAVSIPFSLAVMLAAPLYTSLFNTFTPIQDRALADKILTLAARNGIPAHEVYAIDLSRQTRAANAFVEGVGPTTVIALGDTLLDGFSDEEILFVMAHEMGHYVHKHIWIGLIIALVLTTAGAFCLQRLVDALLVRVGGRARIERAADVSAAPLVLLATMILGAVGTPVGNTISRQMEADADRFALQLTVPGDVSPKAAISTFERLGRLGLSDPDPNPIIRSLLWTHPSLDERIAAVRAATP